MYEIDPVGGTACRYWLKIPSRMMSSRRRRQSCSLGIWMPRRANSDAIFPVFGASERSPFVYLSK